MVLETIRNNNETRVQNITFSEPWQRKDLPFDVEKEISDIDWEQIQNSAIERIQNEEEGDLPILFTACWVAPGRELALPENEEWFSGWRSKKFYDKRRFYNTRNLRTSEFPSSFGIDAHRYPNDPRYLTDITRENIKFVWEISSHASRKHRGRYYQMGILMILTFPELREEMGVNDELLADFKERLKVKDYNWLPRAACARLMFPEEFPAGSFSKIDWKRLKKEFGNWRGDWVNFMEFALYLKILAAKEIRDGERGVELILGEAEPRLESNRKPKIPEGRKF